MCNLNIQLDQSQVLVTDWINCSLDLCLSLRSIKSLTYAHINQGHLWIFNFRSTIPLTSMIHLIVLSLSRNCLIFWTSCPFLQRNVLYCALVSLNRQNNSAASGWSSALVPFCWMFVLECLGQCRTPWSTVVIEVRNHAKDKGGNFTMWNDWPVSILCKSTVDVIREVHAGCYSHDRVCFVGISTFVICRVLLKSAEGCCWSCLWVLIWDQICGLSFDG